MDTVVLTAIRFGLLILLWVFILVALNAMRVDANKAAGQRRTSKKAGSTTRAAVSREKVGHLTVVEGPLQGSHMDISSLSEVVMGRSSDCHFVLGDDYASSRHARLFRRGSEWFVEDLESRNGTFVGGYRIDQPEQASTGTDIKMGRTTVRLIP